MKWLWCWLFLLMGVHSAAADSWNVVPGQSFGPIQSGDNAKDLQALFGAENIRATQIAVGEGEMLEGYVVFPADRQKMFEVIFSDDSSAMSVLLSSPLSRWRVLDQIRVGSSLSDLESINAKSFKLYGFEWDYSGFVSSWNGGRLATYFDRMTIIFEPSDFNDGTMKVLGDAEYLSNTEGMRQAKPRVYKIWVRL